MSIRLFLSSIVLLPLSAFAQMTLDCEFTSVEMKRGPMHFHWNISNRISPMKNLKIPVGDNPLINVVRPLGGKSKKGVKVIEEDTYKWDGQQYYYDWKPLKEVIDKVRSHAQLYQLLIDNPPWAFQRGLDMGDENGIETYGNAWPPNDAEAWSLYIQAMLKELIDTYGREAVEKWRYCIGREIGTRGHWRGTPMEFYEHYENTVEAIHAVVPKAKVGSHFLWGSSKKSLAPQFVRWCHQNDVHYDFIGVSYYPFYHSEHRVDLEAVYKKDFSPIKDIPEWNPQASLEIHEFALIASMNKKGNGFERAPKDQQESFTVMLSKMMYDQGMMDVFRWGTGADNLSEQILREMEGNIYYASSSDGQPVSSGNMVGALCGKDSPNGRFNIMLYCYNADPDHEQSEPVDLNIKLPLASSAEVKYRHSIYEEGQLRHLPWQNVHTTHCENSNISEIKLQTDLKPFSFHRLELRLDKD